MLQFKNIIVHGFILNLYNKTRGEGSLEVSQPRNYYTLSSSHRRRTCSPLPSKSKPIVQWHHKVAIFTINASRNLQKL